MAIQPVRIGDLVLAGIQADKDLHPTTYKAFFGICLATFLDGSILVGLLKVLSPDRVIVTARVKCGLPLAAGAGYPVWPLLTGQSAAGDARCVEGEDAFSFSGLEA